MPTPKKARERFDPYRDYKFRVKWDGRLVAGITHVSGLKRVTEVVEYRDGTGGQSQKLPGRTNYEPITLERGITRERAFEAWANQVVDARGPSLRLRKEVRIEVYSDSGVLLLAYNVHRCWPSEYVALSSLETGDQPRLIQSLTLQNEGWERVVAVNARSRLRRS
ncbi:MAG: phage tail protein [Gemmatimonadota bacterium]|nr:phage tail protein [Gemmatimonadota bacterium]